MTNLESRLIKIEEECDFCKAHYERLYTLNSECISGLTSRLDNIQAVLEGKAALSIKVDLNREFEAREARVPPKTFWPKALSERKIPLPHAGIGMILLYIIQYVIQLILEGRVQVHLR